MYKHKGKIASRHYGKQCFLIEHTYIIYRGGVRDKSFSLLTIPDWANVDPLSGLKLKTKINERERKRDEFEKVYFEIFCL